MSKQAMTLALEALIRHQDYNAHNPSVTTEKTEAAIAALKEAIKQHDAEPVAWATFDGEGGYDLRLYDGNETHHADFIARNGEKYADWVIPLYTYPRIPDGWVMMPKEPTPKMIGRGRTEHTILGLQQAEASYRAMIAAAPKPE